MKHKCHFYFVYTRSAVRDAVHGNGVLGILVAMFDADFIRFDCILTI